jgi:hypothetical protein
MMVPISVFVVLGTVAVVALAGKNREQQRWHELARLALEKGVPVPNMPQPAIPAPSRHRQRVGLITAGLINVAVGIGLFLGLSALPEARVARDFAFIPALCGVALILGAGVDFLLSGKFSGRGDASPKS